MCIHVTWSMTYIFYFTNVPLDALSSLLFECAEAYGLPKKKKTIMQKCISLSAYSSNL